MAARITNEYLKVSLTWHYYSILSQVQNFMLSPVLSCDSVLPRLPYSQYFGGVSAVTPDQYMKMNGFPNQYWGWGGEDDDIAAR